MTDTSSHVLITSATGSQGGSASSFRCCECGWPWPESGTLWGGAGRPSQRLTAWALVNCGAFPPRSALILGTLSVRLSYRGAYTYMAGGPGSSTHKTIMVMTFLPSCHDDLVHQHTHQRGASKQQAAGSCTAQTHTHRCALSHRVCLSTCAAAPPSSHSTL